MGAKYEILPMDESFGIARKRISMISRLNRWRFWVEHRIMVTTGRSGGRGNK